MNDEHQNSTMSVFDTPTALDHALLSVADMTAADAAAIAGGVSAEHLMEQAGAAVARAMLARWPRAPVKILIGPGQNGGDGFVIARHLHEAGWPVEVLALDPDGAWHHAAGLMRRRCPVPLTRASLAALVDRQGYLVDALFGAGLNRPLEGEAAALAEAMASQRVRVVAVDLPSGLHGDGKSPHGAHAAAALTVTFFRKKPVHVLEPGRDLCGDVLVADIGIPGACLTDIAPKKFINAPDLWADAWPWPQANSHKYDRGHALVLSGPPLATGAARLSARAALRMGAGLVSLVGDPASLAVHAQHVTAIMLIPASTPEAFGEALADPRRNALLLGPGAGVGPDTQARVRLALATRRPLVLDADALTSFAEAPEDLFAAIDGSPVVITPHEGEFAQIFPDLARHADIGGHLSKIDRVRRAARRSGAYVVLKGADTVIAGPDGLALVNVNAPSWLATAGSGDVLAGFILGLLAQGMTPFLAAAAGVYAHGWIGAHLGPGLIAEDLSEAVPAFLATEVASYRTLG